MIGWDMILTHKLQDNIAYTVISGFTDETTFTPIRPNETMPLNTEPPGTAAEGWSPRKMISRIVSPIPITFRIVILIFLPDNHHDGVLNIRRS